jgi:DNA-directed RNA polymerase subunit N (RpoN/RPB10)
MIIPVKCCTCGTVPDKYRFYLAEVRRIKMGIDVNKEVYLTTKTKTVKTPEGEVMDSLKLTNVCCRTRMLTHVDIE